jgi:DNA-binding CsgD family transcriptional regulator
MARKLDKKTLSHLYLKEKRSLREIASMYGISYSSVRHRSIKYGITLRPKTWRKINSKLNKTVLQRLYVKEGKSAQKIAEILSCSPVTVLLKCKAYGIPIKTKRIQGITKEMLKKLYVKEGKTTREVAKILNCSFETVRTKCKQFGIPLRNPGNEKIEIDAVTLERLYIKEGKRRDEIAKIFGCSSSAIFQWVRRFGLNNKPKPYLKSCAPN